MPDGEAAGSESWAREMDELAESFVQDGDLDRAIAARREALAGLHGDVPEWIRLDLFTNLGIDLMDRYRHDDDLADLREACAIGERVWRASSPGARLEVTANLAGRLATRSLLPGEPDHTEHARELLEQELAAAPIDDPQRPVDTSALAGIHLQLWRRSGDRDRLRAALRALTDCLDPENAGPEVVNVAGLLATAAEESSDRDLLDQAETLTRAGIAAERPATATVRMTLHRLLASVLHTRYEWTGEPAALTVAMKAAEAAVREAGTAPDRALALSIRSTTRSTAARLRNDRDGFTAAVEDAREALDATADHWRDGEYATNLATLLAERYDLFGDSTDLNEAITLLDHLLATDPDPDMAPTVANNLLARYERDTVPEDLDRAIDLAEQAVALTAPDSSDLAARHDTAGRLHAARAHHRQSPDDLDTAIRHAGLAVAATADGSPDRALYLNNWANWESERWERDRDEEVLSQAIDLLERALAAAGRAEDDIEGSLAATIAFNLGARLHDRFDLHRSRGDTDMETLQRAADPFGEVLGAGYPHLAVVAGRRLGSITWLARMWPEAQQSFAAALEAAGELTGLRPLHADKERARSGVQGLGALAALAAVRAGDPTAAAVHLEQASATLIAEAIGIRAETVTLDGIVASAARMNRHVLMLGSTPAGGVAVLVTPDGTVDVTELPLVNEVAMAEEATVFRQELRRAEDAPDPAGIRLTAADRFAAWTLIALVTPLLPLLAEVSRVAVLPLGRLAWLPITTCGRPGETATLSDFDPILLIRAGVSGQAPVAAGKAPRVVVWADTGPADRPIPAVAREAIEVARQHYGVRPRVDETTELNGDAALDRLLEADLAHLACHCDVDVDSPQETVLRVRPPIRVGLRPDAGRRRGHIVLSACDAALTGAVLPDEAFSAATAFLLAGAGSVTAPLWPVNDVTAPKLMRDYHALLAEGVSPASALAAVQRRWARRRPAYVHGPWEVTAWPDAAADQPVPFCR
ncbi:CHAT domain-containing protein [Actinoplanes sp. CA-015351]|uniref:CHAT domain-containing protein n=1 Tax=Actinoplanes sp. CA-015351 TaxID=3239897 RepID=UPI003D97065D